MTVIAEDLGFFDCAARRGRFDGDAARRSPSVHEHIRAGDLKHVYSNGIHIEPRHAEISAG